MKKSNLFGEHLKDNIKPKEKSYTTQHSGYRLIPQHHVTTIECSFKVKNTRSTFFEKSRFVIWRDRTTNPNVFYWERKEAEADPSQFKFGPFKDIGDAYDDINLMYSFNSNDLERTV